MNNNNRGNNNNNNNRRRGRNNNNRQQGGGQQLNRVDSRARGNAPQMLEKYRKMAHDAHLNGDRVQEEYFLQFADHYFRVIADQRQRQDEQRAPRQPGERWQEGSEGEREPRDDGEQSGEFSDEGDYASYDRPQYNRNDRQERPERPERNERPERSERPARSERPERQSEVVSAGEPQADDSSEGTDSVTAYEPPENPFVRPKPEVRNTRGLKPRRDDRRPQRDGREEEQARGLDPSILPPAISVTQVREDEAGSDAETVAKPAPRRRAPRQKPSTGDSGEALEAAS